jgi:hypothetical protein
VMKTVITLLFVFTIPPTSTFFYHCNYCNHLYASSMHICSFMRIMDYQVKQNTVALIWRLMISRQLIQ